MLQGVRNSEFTIRMATNVSNACKFSPDVYLRVLPFWTYLQTASMTVAGTLTAKLEINETNWTQNYRNANIFLLLVSVSEQIFFSSSLWLNVSVVVLSFLKEWIFRFGIECIYILLYSCHFRIACWCRTNQNEKSTNLCTAPHCTARLSTNDMKCSICKIFSCFFYFVCSKNHHQFHA